MEDAGIDATAAEWIQHKAKREEERLREYTVVPCVLKPKNFGIIREKELIINRIEVLLMTDDTSKPYLIPYLYEGTLKKKNNGSQNNLKEWLFINSDLERVRHSIKHYVKE
ncbi:hypothetical protein HDV06_005040 [Boothiomyces sp. JEL0866]|nr:hypothetical protein HDV06_005040 [Boothiomyces sp. JEL0866]